MKKTNLLTLSLITLFFFITSCGNLPYSNEENRELPPTAIDSIKKPVKKVIEHAWDSLFSKNSLNGTAVLLYPDSIIKISNPERAKKRFCPASTFKIYNSLVALECNSISSTSEIVPWDGVKRQWNQWNQDYSMDSAMKYSCVWFYQHLARKTGLEKMQHFLDTLPYGNATIKDSVDLFWLDGSLQISALEQIKYLNQLRLNQLPFKTSVQEDVKRIMLTDSTENYQIRSKTGWSIRLDKHVGWLVGFIERESTSAIFALNIDMKGKEDTHFRQDIVYQILEMEGLLN